MHFFMHVLHLYAEYMHEKIAYTRILERLRYFLFILIV